MNKVRLGVVGLGAMGRHHARMVLKGLIPNCELTAVCDAEPEKLSAFDGPQKYERSSDLIRSKLVDAVLIATPHYSHCPIGIDVLETGLHLLVEKPISAHLADAQKLVAAHRDKSLVFSAMFNQRTDPRFQKIRQMIQEGTLGRLNRVQWTITNWFRSQAYYDSGGWRATWKGEGGGVLLNQAVHNLDLYQWIFGMPERVHAICGIGKYHNIEVEDEVSALFEHGTGFTSVFVTSTGESPGVNRLEIAADMGRLTLDQDKLTFVRNTAPTSRHLAETSEGYIGPENETIEYNFDGKGEQHAGILKNFTNAILHSEPLIAPAAHGLGSLELISAMMLSSMKKKNIELPVEAREYEILLAEMTEKSQFRKRVKNYEGGHANYLLKDQIV